MISFGFSATEQLLLIIMGVLFAIQCVYYLAIYNRVYLRNKSAARQNGTHSNALPPISVIICAKNESENLRAFLPSVLQQDYPEYEVVVINDGSTDATSDYLKLLKTEYNHLYHSFTPENTRNISHRKLAMTLGIKASKHEWLVFIEANCHPVSKEWLRTLARNFTPDTDIVLGYSGYEQGSKLFQRYISFDNLFRSMRYLGYALCGKPYMGVGRNLAYRRSCFFEQKGFSSHLNLQRGEDDLFINQFAHGRNTRVETDPRAVVEIKKVEIFHDWREVQIGRLSIIERLKGIQPQVLAFETVTRFLFFLAVCGNIYWGIATCNWVLVGVAVLLWLLRVLAQGVVINKTATALGEKQKYYALLPLFNTMQTADAATF